ncbi:Citrate transporter [Polystyrenella longa]|uniref:Citrate transporter n=1 Tax=Polystyrenella longa TaxID=2528007 RepID=A0A518CI55_9PLAN|nr:SLC13 family permease [Polystyrenella longa]QDU78913.1 Citrate transporter [Polystyrenella longa]
MITLSVLAIVLLSLIFMKAGPDLILIGGLTLLVITGVVPAEKAIEGFASKGLLTVAFLYVVAEGMRQTGAMNFLGQRWLGTPKGIVRAQAKIALPAAIGSAFINNTPIVAMVMPLMTEWSRKIGISVSHLLLPLSYATILGGMCTLIGTSTTVVLNGTLRDYEGLSEMGMYDISIIGIPIMVIGLAYLLLVSKRLIPERKSAHQEMSNAREYSVEMLLEPTSPLVGQTIEQAGLRSLPGMYLIEIERQEDVIPAVSPQERLMGNDRLIFVGVVDSVIDLQKFPGLKTAADQQFRLEKRHNDRVLIEAVVANSFPFKNRTIRDCRFRSYYNAAVIAVTRDGQRVDKKIGDITLESGDTLLLEARPSFLEAQRNSRDFYLVSEVQNSRAPRHERAWAARIILIGMIILVSFQFFGIDMLKGSMLAACVMIATRCCRASEAKASIDLSVLLTIAAGIGLGEAMIYTETHNYLAGKFVSGIDYMGDDLRNNPRLALAIMCGLTMLFNNIITAKAAGLLCLPISVAVARELGVDPWPFAIAVIIGAASSFATPHGYQTNQMIYGPGGYKLRDYMVIGIPLSLIVCLITTIITPLWWPF